MIGVVDPHPCGSHPIVTAEETVCAVIGPHHINRRMSVTRSGLAETHGNGTGDIGDFGGGDGAEPHVGVAVKTCSGRHPDLARDPKNGPGPVGPG